MKRVSVTASCCIDSNDPESGGSMTSSRRTFLKEAAAAVAAGAVPPSPVRAANHQLRSRLAESGGGGEFIDVRDGRLHVETETLTAVIDKGFVTSLKNRATGEDLLVPRQPSGAALRLLYRGSETVGIDESRYGSIECRKLSGRRAEIIFHNWDADGLIAVTVDPESGDLVLEPSAYSSRPGVRACRWMFPGIRADLDLVAPLFQGVKLKLDDPLLRGSRWTWPQAWEAGFVVLQGMNGGFWIHTQDDSYRYKALLTGDGAEPNTLAFDSETYGPADDSLAAGGLQWRINVFQGEWKTPVQRYRDWLWRAYRLDAAERSRRPWIRDVRLAISWCPGDLSILDALAKRVDPRRILLHFPNWRTDNYDENYPTYVASESARSFIAKCASMGFHVMPHFNSLEVDPGHPVYPRVRDFQFRDIESRKIMGWSWVDGRVLGVPESNLSRLEHRDKKVMAKIHPGLSMWRNILSQAIADAAASLSLESVFIDVTLNTFNLHNSVVENKTSTEGIRILIDEVAGLGNGLVVGGEGLNEITAQGESFAQVHLFRSWQGSAEGLERTGGCPLNDFLLGRLCRTFGYSSLGGRTAAEELRMRIHEEHGAIPTITVRSAREITDPNPAVKRILDQAAG
jgi:hypothetical protein